MRRGAPLSIVVSKMPYLTTLTKRDTAVPGVWYSKALKWWYALKDCVKAREAIDSTAPDDRRWLFRGFSQVVQAPPAPAAYDVKADPVGLMRLVETLFDATSNQLSQLQSICFRIIFTLVSTIS